MDDDTAKEILNELRKQTQQNEFNKKASIAALAILVLIIPVLEITHHRKPRSPEPVNIWSTGREAFDSGDYDKAIELTQTLVEKNPNYYYCYTRLGWAYLAKGDLVRAEANCLKAYELYPSEDNEKTLASIRRAIENKNRPANKASDATSEPAPSAGSSSHQR